ncbi:hypothetical protein EIP86_005151 [Pleurotus ostreatoroseus]|nr:hypothetical protein EIP86_005151 [Pleurotus ostreatoroseus]
MQPIDETDDQADNTALSADEIVSSLDAHDDVVSWINDVLDVDQLPTAPEDGEQTSLTDLDRRITQLVGTLELASEDTSSTVERIIDDISRGASRLTYDLHFMREGALSLQSILRSVETQSQASVAADTSAALDRLHFLDTVKHNMEAAREVLREAESWSTLESDVISLLGEQNYERAAERLSEANKSMVVFQNTPEYESRRTLMISLQNQMEASLSSALVAAVNSQDVAVCRNYFSIFRNIQRESEFRNYYYGSRKASLVEMWQKARLSDCDAGADPSAQTFAQFLPTFFSAFLSMLSTERSSIPAIFPDPQPTMSTLITSTLSSLQPSFGERLIAVNTSRGAKSLPELIAAFKAAQDFAVATDKILEKVAYAAQLPPTTPDVEQNKTLRRRSSTRMSISRRMGPHRASISGNPLAGSGPAGVITDWEQELLEPFVDLQADYGVLERRFLLDALQDIFGPDVRSPQPQSSATGTDTARMLRERSVDLFGAADEAITRCLAFTHGYGSLGLVRALDAFFVAFAERSKADLKSRRGAAGGGLSTSASGDLSDLDYTPEDWADIQSLLHVLGAVRALHDRTLAFEGRLRAALQQVSNTLRLARGDPAEHHFSGTTRGAVQLLAQSSLNSAELHELLDRADPEAHSQASSRGDPFLTPTPPANDIRRASQAFHLFPAQAPLLVDARAAVSSLAGACQVALQDTILLPLRTRLAQYPTLPVWATESDKNAKARGGSALSEVQVPTFSLSPTAIMQRLAEGLLNLPRLFEVYADDDALAFSLETLPCLPPALLRTLAEPPPPEGVASPVGAGPLSMSGSGSGSGHGHPRRASSLSLKTPPVLPPPALPELTPEAVSAAWLASLGRALLAHLTRDVLPAIRGLGAGGAAQLAADLGYLASIVAALNVEDAALERWKACVEMEDAVGRLRAREEGGEDGVLAAVARLRGWPTS